MERLDGATWREVPEGETLPRSGGAVSLRFRFSGYVDLTLLESRVEAALPGQAVQFRRPDENTLEMTIPDLPPVFTVQLHFPRLPGELVLYAGPQPRLVAVDPATGKEEVLGQAPVDVHAAAVSPDGKGAGFIATDRNGVYNRVLVADFAGGGSAQVPATPYLWSDRVAWYAGRAVLATHQKVHYATVTTHHAVASAGTWWAGVSPDGRYMAGFARTKEPTAVGITEWANIIVHDLQTGTERVYANAARLYVRPHALQLRILWSPDGKSLLLGDYEEPQKIVPKRLDLANGTVTPAGEPLPEDRGMPTAVSSMGWKVQTGRWGPVILTAPDGKQHSSGEGFPVGWAADGRLFLIRWEPGRFGRTPITL